MRKGARLRFLAALAVSVSVQVSLAAPVNLTGDTKAAGAVWNTFQTWLHAYEVGDLDQTMAIFDQGVVFEFQGAKDQSYDDLRNGYVADFKARAPGTRWVPSVEEVYSDGMLAFVRSTWELRVSSAGTPEQTKARNRSMDVFRRVNGNWHIIRSINYPEKG